MDIKFFKDEETGDVFSWKACIVSGCDAEVCVLVTDEFCWRHFSSGKAPFVRRVVEHNNRIILSQSENAN